jgi:hypothetical protein
VLIFPISIGRALLFAIIRLPLACGLKSNGNDFSEIVLGLLGFLGKLSKKKICLTTQYFLLDLLAFVVGFGIISSIIAASRDSFGYMTCGRAHLQALNHNLVMFLWVSNCTWEYCFYSMLHLIT